MPFFTFSTTTYLITYEGIAPMSVALFTSYNFDTKQTIITAFSQAEVIDICEVIRNEFGQVPTSIETDSGEPFIPFFPIAF